MPSKPLRHPNVMSEAQRLALPDPTRPIDSPVIPVGRTFAAFYDEMGGLSDFGNVDLPRHHSDTPPVVGLANSVAQSVTMVNFIHEQQQHAQHAPSGFWLPLSQLPPLLKTSGLSWWQTVINAHPELSLAQTSAKTSALSELEQRLYGMAQLYQVSLCVFLLCQCKARKTLNPQITLQDLSDAINDYVQAHQSELQFLTQQTTFDITPAHVEFAVVALGWQMSKQADIAKRTTTISSQNPLTQS